MSGPTWQSAHQLPHIGVTQTIGKRMFSVKNKANKTLGFIKRNLHQCPDENKEQCLHLPC